MNLKLLVTISILATCSSWAQLVSQNICQSRPDPVSMRRSENYFINLSDLTCENVRESAECQRVYENIKKSGHQVEDFQLKCKLRDSSKLSFGRMSEFGKFYLGCYRGYFDATIGDLGEFIAGIVTDMKTDFACNKSLKAKRMLYQVHNVENPPDLQIAIPSDAKLKAYDCSTIRRSIFYEHRDRQIELMRTGKLNPPNPSQQSVLDLSKAALKEIDIRLECYSPEKQAQLLCSGAMYAAMSAKSIAALAKLRSVAGLSKIETLEESAKLRSELIARAGEPPKRLFDFDLVLGAEVDAKTLPFSVKKNSKVYRLGSGAMGGTVYRAIPEKGPIEVYKVYPDVESAADDFNKLTILHDVSQKPGYKGLAIVKPIKRKGRIVKMGNEEGETIEQLAGDPMMSAWTGKDTAMIPQDQLTVIRNRYREQLQATFDALKREIPSLEINMSESSAVYIDANHRRQNFFLHPGNILVNPKTGQLTVIDPY